MVEHRRDSAQETLLSRIQSGLATASGPGSGTRRCPCCGRPLRAGQLITTIHGTSVHVRCASRS
jgi:hypothetical protein